MEAPDLAGFAAAQERLRGHFGEPVVFLRPVDATWPPGTPIDPESGRPYDPMVEPVSSGQASAVVSCDVATRPYGKADVEWDALGATEKDHIMLIAGSGAASAIEGSSEFEVRDGRYAVTSMRFDGIGGLQRHLTFGRLAGR